MKTYPVLVVVLLSILFAPTKSFPARIRMSLEKLTMVEDVRLQGASDRTSPYRFSIPVPERWTVRDATLHFSFINSNALLKDRSQLIVYLGENPLGQISLDPLSPKGDVSLPIPGQLLKPGYNAFSFQAAQHYQEEGCEDPGAPELWTWIDLRNAYVIVEYDEKPLPLRLSAVIDFLFEAPNPNPPDVHIIIPELNSEYLHFASRAASGVALRYDYRPIRFSVSDHIRDGADNIAIGPPDFLNSLNRAPFPEIMGATLRIAQAPLSSYPEKPTMENEAETAQQEGTLTFDPTRALIMATGRTLEEIDRASLALSLLSYPLPNSSSVRVEDIVEPELSKYLMQDGLTPGKTYTLSSLGFKNTGFEGSFPTPAGFQFRLPSDVHLSQNRFVTLYLNMAFGAGMRSDSTLNIRVNDRFVGAVRLNDDMGGFFRGYQVQIMLSAFRPGDNNVVFVPVLTPMITDQCTFIQTQNLRLTVFSDSRLILPDIPHWIEMPQLEALMRDGFPFSMWPDFRDSEIFVADKNFMAAGAAVNAVALLARKIGYPPTGLTWRLGPPTGATGKNGIVVGSLPAIPESLMAAAPVDILAKGRTPEPQIPRPKPLEEPSKDLWSRFIPKEDLLPTNVTRAARPDTAIIRFGQALSGGRAAMMEFQSPHQPDRTFLIFTAADSETLQRGGRALWEPAVQSALAGDLALIDLGHPDFRTQSLSVGDPYYLGGVGAFPKVEYYVNTYPWIFLGVVVGLLMAMALLTYLILRRIRRKRIPADA